MEVRLLLLVFICLHALHWAASAQQPEEATVIVKGSTKIAETNKNYICATIDWWPPEKCNYNQCPWGQSSILNLVLLCSSLGVVLLLYAVIVHWFMGLLLIWCSTNWFM